MVEATSILPLNAQGKPDLTGAFDSDDLLMQLEDSLFNWHICEPDVPVKEIVKSLGNQQNRAHLIEEGNKFEAYLEKIKEDTPLETVPQHKTLDIFPSAIEEDLNQVRNSERLGLSGWQNYLLSCKLKVRAENTPSTERTVIFNHKTYDQDFPDPVLAKKERDRLMLQTYIMKLNGGESVDGCFALLYNTRRGQMDLVEADHFRLYQIIEARNRFVLNKLEYLSKWNVKLEFSVQPKEANLPKKKGDNMRSRPNNNQYRENKGYKPFYSNEHADYENGYEPVNKQASTQDRVRD